MINQQIKQLPLTAGVYVFKDALGQAVYIGKASCLRKRVQSHFLRQSLKREVFLQSVKDIEYIPCHSPQQALILEAALIKERKPKYNVALRDNKTYPYLEITDEEFPRVFISRSPKGKGQYFGPYPQAQLLKSALVMLRKVFPFCSCSGSRKKGCLYNHIKLCPGPCKSRSCSQEYQQNIEAIKQVLTGNRQELIRQLEKTMADCAKQKDYESAKRAYDKIIAVRNLYEGRPNTHALIALQQELGLAKVPLTIEGIDISTLSGTLGTGAVVVFKDGVADKSSYRRFKIKQIQGNDDYAMIGQVVWRRYSRMIKEKNKLPDLIVIDGGKGHLQRAVLELNRLQVNIAVIGLAKENEEIWSVDKTQPLCLAKDNPGLQLLQQVRDEAHRFCRSYHFLLRSKKMKA